MIVLSIHPEFSKYRIEYLEDEFTGPNTYFYYDDLDFDGESEKISFDLNDSKQTKILFYKGNNLLDQYNLKYHPIIGTPYLYTNDYDNDNYKESYIFTMSEDSIFLNIIDPLKSQSYIRISRFIDLRRKDQQSDDIPQAIPVVMIESQNQKFKDLVFYITTGFSGQPRNVYRYNIVKDTLIKSPQSGATIRGCKTIDLNDDLLTEFILDVAATGNLEEDFPFSDQHSWFMILDNNLNFLYPPIKIGEYQSQLQVLPLKINNSLRLVVFYNYFGSAEISSLFCLFDTKRNKIYEKPIQDFENYHARFIVTHDINNQTFYFLKNRKSEVLELDSSFTILRSLKLPPLQSGIQLAELDANIDGKKELIFNPSSYLASRMEFRFPKSNVHNASIKG